MRKGILLLVIFIIIFLCAPSITFAPSSKTSELQRKPEIIPDQLRIFSRIERQKQEKEVYLEWEEREIRSKDYSSNVELVGMWPYGPCQASDLDTTRNIAVIGNGETLQVLDISNPSSPLKMGEVFLEAKPRDIAISGDYVYVLSSYSLRVIDISTLSSPHEVGNADISGTGYAIAVDYPYIYVAAYSSGLRILDVSSPYNPTEVGFYDPYHDPYNYEYFRAYGVAIWDNYVFVRSRARPDTDYVYQLRIIDISDPSTPTLTGTFQVETDLYVQAIDASDSGYAYISLYSYTDIGDDRIYTGELKIIDVASDPANPIEVGNYVESDSAFLDVVVSGNYAYIFDWRLWGLKVIDISNIADPFSVGECDSEGYWFYSQGLVISGNYIGIVHYGDGLGLYDISNPENPFHLGFCDTEGAIGYYGNPIAVSGDHAFIASCTKGLMIMDISTPSNLSVVGKCDTVFGWGGVSVSENYAYGVDRGGFWIVDVSSPTNPSQVGYLDYSENWGTFDVYVSENYAYVCGSQFVSDEPRASFDIINVSDPSNLKITGSYISPARSYNYGGIALSGNLAYLALRDYSTGSTRAGLKIIDISHPTNPVEVGNYVSSDDGYSYDVEVRGNYAYIAGDDFRIIDVSNPSSPSEISSDSANGYGIALSGNYAYLNCNGLELIDISNPYNPVEAGYFYNELEDAVAVSGNYAYIPGSLYILKNILAPEVSITSPSEWSEVSGSVSIEVQASHSSGISKVEFYIDDSWKALDTTSPYSYEWDTTSTEESSHKIRARAYNYNGKTSDAEIEVIVKKQFDLTISSASGGTTDPEPGTYSYPIDSDVSVTAIPDSDFRFSGWTGDIPEGHEEDNPLTITMDGDKSIEANFVRQYTLTTVAGTGGTTDPSPGSYTYDSGTQVTVTATANTGYQFSSWSGDASGMTNPITITMDEDKSITANFTQIPIDGDGDNGGGGSCFIATAAYGSPLHPHVDILRDLRDKYLLPNKFGRKLVGLYYKYSPFVANMISKSNVLKMAVRIYLLPIIAFSYSMVHLGPIKTGGVLLLIFLLPVFLVLVFQRK